MKVNVQNIVTEVMSLLAEISVPAEGLASEHSVFLATRQELEHLSGKNGCIGLAYTTKSPLTARSEQGKVLLLDTLTRPKLEATLGHEIFHLYSSHNSLSLGHAIEEGTAELVAFYIYKRIGEMATNLHHSSMHTRGPDVYGEGFRQVFKFAQELGGIKNYFQQLVPNPRPVPAKFIRKNLYEILWHVPTQSKHSPHPKEWWKSEQEIVGVATAGWWNS